jgi:pimeloyl-ACP methyl ester carboxylesterase
VSPEPSTLVLVHGAGHTSLVWRAAQDQLRHPSLAVDLPGRRNRPGDLTRLTIAEAVESVAADLDQAEGTMILVGHSCGGVILPALAARLDGRVNHLVFVAGLCAPHGEAVVDSVHPDGRAAIEARLADMRDRYGSRTFQLDRLDRDAPGTDDVKLAMPIESYNFMLQTVSWDGVPASLARTFVRCLRDQIQSPQLQAKLIANCDASTVIDIDAGHTPALDDPAALAAVLDRIADESAAHTGAER